MIFVCLLLFLLNHLNPSLTRVRARWPVILRAKVTEYACANVTEQRSAAKFSAESYYGK